jgi:hypothetical protein
LDLKHSFKPAFVFFAWRLEQATRSNALGISDLKCADNMKKPRTGLSVMERREKGSDPEALFWWY